MSSWLDSTACAVTLYSLAGATALTLGAVERRRRETADTTFWPAFWFATGALLVVMAIGRAANVSDVITGLGRQEAQSEGWYGTRRSIQAWLIGATAVIWTIAVAVAVWRGPQRRWRYLPTAVVVFTLVGFAGVRLISLHQVDALLGERAVDDLTIGGAIEVVLLLSVLVVSAWRFPRGNTTPSEPTAARRVAPDAAPPVRG